MFWVLTGDKKETAINIGRSTKVIDEKDSILVIDGDWRTNELIEELKRMNRNIKAN